MSVNSPDGDSCWRKTSILYLIPQTLYYLNLVITESWVIYRWDSSTITLWFSFQALSDFFLVSSKINVSLNAWQNTLLCQASNSTKDSASSDSCYYIKIFHGFCSEWIFQVFFSFLAECTAREAEQVIDQSD